jgi:hypothetical protein
MRRAIGKLIWKKTPFHSNCYRIHWMPLKPACLTGLRVFSFMMRPAGSPYRAA